MIIHDIKERLLSNSYYLYKIKGFKRKWRRFVNDDTGIVIEGYPRCANSLLVDSFIISQDYRVRVASHSHHWAQVIEGLKKNLPVVVTIRNPVDAAASLLLRRNEISDNTALHVYEVFHRMIIPHKDRILFVRFEDVIESPSRVITIINERFGTNYVIPSDVLKEELQKKSLIESAIADPVRGMLEVCYPNDEKKKKSIPIKERIRSHPMMPRLEVLYRECLNASLNETQHHIAK
jgi:hypothetical protein